MFLAFTLLFITGSLFPLQAWSASLLAFSLFLHLTGDVRGATHLASCYANGDSPRLFFHISSRMSTPVHTCNWAVRFNMTDTNDNGIYFILCKIRSFVLFSQFLYFHSRLVLFLFFTALYSSEGLWTTNNSCNCILQSIIWWQKKNL